MSEFNGSIPTYSRYEKRIPQKFGKKFSKRFVLISDSHITQENNPAFNSVIFRKMLQEIKSIKNVDYYLHLGDITQEGTYLDYETAIEMISPLRSITDNFYIIPGNHDSRNVGYLLFEETFGKRTFEIEDDNIIVIGVDSSIPDQDDGNIGDHTLKRSEQKFMENQDKIKIFCFHHQLVPIPFTGRERAAVLDGGDVLEMALKSNVDVIINGHRHISNIYTCTDGDQDLVIFNCGTASANKTRYRELFSYTILDLTENIAKFTTKMMFDDKIIKRGRHIHQKFQVNGSDGSNVISRIIHMGSTHFSNSAYNEQIYDKAINQINKINPDLIIHTGSLTYTNNLEEYKIAKEKIKDIQAPLILLPGSKDLKKYGWNIFPQNIGGLEPKFENDKIRLLSINTILPHISNGSVGRKKMWDTVNYFKEQPHEKINIVALNHRLIPPPKLKYEKILTDSGGVLKNFTDPLNNIDIILMGKNNIGFTLQMEDTILSYCGTISSKFMVESEKHAFNIIEKYKNGFIKIIEYNIDTGKSQIIGQYWTHLKQKI